jgi:hypothetical protein
MFCTNIKKLFLANGAIASIQCFAKFVNLEFVVICTSSFIQPKTALRTYRALKILQTLYHLGLTVIKWRAFCPFKILLA